VLERSDLGLHSIWGVPWAGGAAGSCGFGPGANGALAPGSSAGGQQRAGGSCKNPSGAGKLQGVSAESAAEPEFSTWKFRTNGEARRVIDHVYYSAPTLAPASRWRGPSAAEIGPGGLPCAGYPSDHVALLAAFEWLP
jgi:hypothetical protein